MGSVAAAPVSTPSTKASPKPSPSAKPGAKATPRLSKWQQHINEEMKVSAPGDEYFGRMKMSYLGINNTFRDNMVRAGDYTTDQKIVSSLAFADEALTAWAKKYPNDPQLARSYFLAFQMYGKVWIQTYQDKAWQYAHIVVQKWPSSYFGKALSKDLKIGFTEHYFADPEPCPEVLPSESPSPGRHPTPTPSPTPTPEPTPTPTPRPGMPPAQVLPVPCFTPSPAPTIAPVVTPSGSPIPIPSGSLAPSSASPAPSAMPSTTAPTPAASTAPTAAPPTAAPSAAASSAPSAAPSPAPTTTHRPHR